MNIDIVSLVRVALIESGCDESLLEDFDAHSTISLDFENSPSLLISMVDDSVWIWSKICEAHDTLLHHSASAILEKIMSGCQFSITGQLQLTQNDGYLELRGMVHPGYLESSQRFADALDEFFSHQEDFLGLIR